MRRLAQIWGAILGLGLLAQPTAARPAASEYDVKASYLFKLGPFVNWPAGAAARRVFVICVLGQDPFGARLDQAVRGQAIGGRPVYVRRMTSVAPGGGDCDVLYLARPSGQTTALALAAVRGAPILTVSDAGQGFSGGVVHFVLRGQRVRFTIDVAAAERQGLQISSKLLGLAVAP